MSRAPHVFVSLLASLLLSLTPKAAVPQLSLIPCPAEVSVVSDAVPLPATLEVQMHGPASTRIQSGMTTLCRLWQSSQVPAGASLSTRAMMLTLTYTEAPVWPALGIDEAYSLSVAASEIRIEAKNDIGILRALATLAQLPVSTGSVRQLPLLKLRDAPRFPWRGLMIDVARHWQPIEVIERNLDAMALVKLNVLHLHLTEDQGFRIESRTHPELHLQGSDGHYFTQDQVRRIVALANERGIRVIPEFDIPGHATSWVVSHPELASLPGPYAIERRWGIFDPVLDPTNEDLYALLGDFLGEMAELFPYPVLHIGGDENNGVQWNANPAIQRFIQERNLKDNAGLHAYFNRRIAALLAAKGKRVMGWDEILHPDLPADAIIHSWRGPTGLAEAAKSGRQTVLSNGYYIDLAQPVEEHYLNDPLPENSSLTSAEQARVLGGEATMWAEWVQPDTIDSRIWPRTAAIAERLWSSRDVKDLNQLQRRLPQISAALAELGLTHLSGPESRLRRNFPADTGESVFEAARIVVAAMEPVKQYRRGVAQPEGNQLLPLDTLADIAVPDSSSSRRLAENLETLLRTLPTLSTPEYEAAVSQFDEWRRATETVLAASIADSRGGNELRQRATTLRALSRAGATALADLRTGTPTAAAALRDAGKALLEAHVLHPSATEFVFLPSLRMLVTAAANPNVFKSVPAIERRAALERLAPPLPN